MGFNKNPHVAKAQAAEQKAEQADDTAARQMAWREAGHLWERASERETDAKRKKEYEQKAERARDLAEGGTGGDEDEASGEHPVMAPPSGVLN